MMNDFIFSSFIYGLDVFLRVHSVYSMTATSNAPLQVVGFERERTHFGFGQTAAYTSTWNALKTILQKEGIRGCFKGLLPSLIKSAPSSAITLAVYDSLRLLLMHHEL